MTGELFFLAASRTALTDEELTIGRGEDYDFVQVLYDNGYIILSLPGTVDGRNSIAIVTSMLNQFEEVISSHNTRGNDFIQSDHGYFFS
jgi:hypothetical protein